MMREKRNVGETKDPFSWFKKEKEKTTATSAQKDLIRTSVGSH
jgi:hypothetical protein